MTSSLGPPALAAVSSPLHAVSPATPAMPIAAPLRTDRRLNMFCSVSALTWLGALNVWWRPSKDDRLAVPWPLPIARPEQSVLKLQATPRIADRLRPGSFSFGRWPGSRWGNAWDDPGTVMVRGTCLLYTSDA